MPTIGRWHWDEWGRHDPGGSLEAWTESLTRRAGRDVIPTTLVALVGDSPVGSSSLVKHDMSTRQDLSPWLAGVFVASEWRRRGVATALIGAALGLAGRLGVTDLYLYTDGATGLYARLGWEEIGREFYEGREVTIMQIRTP